ncbi:MAG: L-serine ammonia-lyase, iron-sulfur-dependent, subunit alpha [Synergistales bacterium]|nr:L-serine ammonia-lyase, iron-sulfur-dependent, subunit alpha [Synergistales bacterium]MDY6402245.1 L-serine ammonia-lyase, iron-sulfur-dependent, subunit alpha [Synergistales bacterium]MDY6404976.1 L-serine ammonia-lyase, iron-sulfur-dependent, subunit alpha [Synergistales bacterium]MDY6410327.1 L-serine ammonia-lyase, iron-sulfur-dependent, subunit alpha [Synergistales bacterium]MDY6414325.1 L-serine ammonia-lyase, iron-sulfur-dependent, subunit alpha [Synergistales bacterium]
MDKKLYENYTAILREELMPAMGCTEPIAIAYASARARAVLGKMPEKIHVSCSGNIIKNVKGVIVPNSGNQKGIEVAAILGAVGGNESKELEVIAGATDEARAMTKKLAAEKICSVSLAENVPNLFIEVEAEADGHKSVVRIENHHTDITLITLDGKIIFEKAPKKDEAKTSISTAQRNLMTLSSIIDYANELKIEDVKEILERQIEFNSKISQEGLDNKWGARVGKTVLENWGSDVRSRACARAAAGSDARMSGCPLPVIINSGSGNQGITVSLPVIEYAENWHLSREKLYRALAVSNLVSIYIKHYIGSLSAFCGAVSAASGAGAAITYMAGGDYQSIGGTITNTLANVGGIVCDGAKPSCAAKIASSVHAALMAHYMSMSDKEFLGGEGFVNDDVERTIKNMGYIGKIGMKETDKEILNVMIDKIDVDSCLSN